jgi:hypothetical protein
MRPVKRPFDPGSKEKPAGMSDSAPAPAVVGRWTELCFPSAEQASQILVAEDDARDDNDESSAVEWAQGYDFPDRYIDSDVKLLRASALFEVMVRRRQNKLAPDRLSRERVSRLRPDNPTVCPPHLSNRLRGSAVAAEQAGSGGFPAFVSATEA